MMDFYNLLDIYAELNEIDTEEALQLWYRGTLTPRALIQAYLNNEGIYGYTDSIIQVFRILQEKTAESITEW